MGKDIGFTACGRYYEMIRHYPPYVKRLKEQLKDIRLCAVKFKLESLTKTNSNLK